MSDQEKQMAERLWLALDATVRQELMGLWARIATLESQNAGLKAELKKRGES